jgi:hypothetical protein
MLTPERFGLWFGLWGLTPFSTIFHGGGQFYRWRKPEYPEKTTNPLTDLWVLHGRDRMVVGFTTTYAISAYHHYRCDCLVCGLVYGA